MVVTLCSSGAVKLKAGANASVLTNAQYEELINQAESFINTSTRYDFVTAYAGLTDAFKKILEDAASSYAAIGVINYDMGGFSSRTEAQVMLDVNWNKIVEIINLLRDDKFKTALIKGGVD